MQAAKKHGTIVSYDLNYRPELWKSIGGQKRAQEVNREIAKHVDVMIGNEEDFTACLGFDVEGADENLLQLDVTAFKKMIGNAVKEYPEFQSRRHDAARRQDRHASTTGARFAGRTGNFTRAQIPRDLEILDRVGGGDSFASGLIYGLMQVRRSAKSRRIRRGARRARDDNAGRHLDGVTQGSGIAGGRRRCPGTAVDSTRGTNWLRSAAAGFIGVAASWDT